MTLVASKGLSCGTHDGAQYWINSEPCGLICGCMTYFLIIYGQVATTRFVILPWLGYSIIGVINIICYNALSFVAMYSHYKAMTTDPGAVPACAKPLSNDQQEIDYEAHERWNGTENINNRYRKYCKKCKAFKPIRAHHCSICSRCIVKMDHHCPWVNNCVGIGNHKLFLLFLFWINVMCDYSLLLIACRYAFCMLGRTDCSGSDDGNLCIILLMVEAALFGLFTLCMMGDQSTVVTTNQTQIDRLKKSRHEAKVVYNEVFGCAADVSFQWKWLLPVAAVFPDHCRDSIFGYQLPEIEEREELTPLTSSVDEASSSPLHTSHPSDARIELDQDASLTEEGTLEMALVGNSREDHNVIENGLTSIAKSVDSMFPPQSEASVTEIAIASVLAARREKSQ